MTPLQTILISLLELLARLAGPTLRDRLARLANRQLPSIPVLEGHWIASFQDPNPEGDSIPLTVEVELQQFGRKLTGTGHLLGEPKDTWRFAGTIKRNVFFGSYERSSAHVLAGSGSFILKVAAHSKTMKGRCMWFDALLDDVWTSSYQWRIG